MKRILQLFVLFTLGILGAWIVVVISELSSTDSSPKAPSSEAKNTESYRSAVRAQLTLAEASPGLSSREREFRGALSRGERLEEFRFAVQNDTPEGLRSIRSELLSDLPDYQTTLLPQLKRWSLDELLFRFSRSDWRDWPRAAVGNAGEPTRARSFVTSVTVVNRDLGVYLETAAYLFHGLFKATNLGLPYILRTGVRSVTDNADAIVSSVGDSALRARFSLASSILLEPNFRELFERERCALVGEYLSLSKDTERNVKLVGSLNSDYCSADVSGEVGEVLQAVLSSGSLRYREALLEQEAEVRTLDGFARNDSRVSEPLAALYVKTGRELVQEGKLDLARRYIGESVSLQGSPEPSGEIGEIYRGFARRSNPRRYQIDVEDVQDTESSGALIFAALFFGMALVLGLVVVVFKRKKAPLPASPVPVVIRPRAEIKEFPKAASLKRG